ncbi:TIGR03089 family protein [Glutamicibacter sp. X7]
MTDTARPAPYIDDLLSTRRAQATPWLIWHSHEGERIELSGRVFDNWVAKSANLLMDLPALNPGDTVVLDLPTHWKSLVLAFAIWHHGAVLTTPDDELATEAVLWVGTDPNDARIPPAAEILAVNLASLALAFDGDLGPVAEDYTALVRSFADSFSASALPGHLTALAAGSTKLSLAEICNGDRKEQGTVALNGALPLPEVLPWIVERFAAGDSIVLLGEQVELSDSLRSSEGIGSEYGFAQKN